MTGPELWLEVTDGHVTVEEFIAGAKADGLTVEEAVKVAVTAVSECFEFPAGTTVESITAALVEWINQQCPFHHGVHVQSRFGPEWELLTTPDKSGYVLARRLEDGKERPLHTSDIKCIICTKCNGTGLRPLTVDEYTGKATINGMTFGPITDGTTTIGVTTTHCECEAGREKAAKDRRRFLDTLDALAAITASTPPAKE